MSCNWNTYTKHTWVECKILLWMKIFHSTFTWLICSLCAQHFCLTNMNLRGKKIHMTDIIKSWPKKFVMCHTDPTKKQSCYPSQSWHLYWPTTREIHGWGEKKANLFEVGGTIGYGTYLLKLSFKPPKRENNMQEKILCFHPLLACLLS
jgi:hypothetical protein